MSNNFIISYLICPQCGMKYPIPRKNGQQREKGHRKRFFCPICATVFNMKEIREGDYEVLIDDGIATTLYKDGKYIFNWDATTR